MRLKSSHFSIIPILSISLPHFCGLVIYYRTGLPYLIFVSFHQALESLPCPVTILMLNCPFDIGDQEHLVEDVRDEKSPET
ncbi:hypothetical protein T06_9047 [Trichinella sp. T6]|nr:hypothetical protein T06_9047 [Trichinella sp. T6]